MLESSGLAYESFTKEGNEEFSSWGLLSVVLSIHTKAELSYWSYQIKTQFCKKQISQTYVHCYKQHQISLASPELHTWQTISQQGSHIHHYPTRALMVSTNDLPDRSIKVFTNSDLRQAQAKLVVILKSE
jgi:hypothetical protein